MSLLEIKNVIKNYKINGNETFTALKGIDITFEKNELVSIIGESGSGKSTLMNLIGGLDSDFEGEIKVNGKNIKKFTEKELDRYRKDKIGFIFQSFNLIPHLSVLDNVTIAMTLSNASKKDRVNKATEILSSVGLKDHINKKPNQLSGGQKQRVAIARALINNPDILLADEPTGSLDSVTSNQILEIIKEIANSGKLVIMVTHSERVAAFSDRVVTLADGKIIDDKVANKRLDNQTEEIKSKKKQNLSFASAIKLALNNMKEKIFRNLLVSIGASIGIASVVTMFSIGNGVEAYITDTMHSYVNPLVVEVNQKSDNEDNDNKFGPPSVITEVPKMFNQTEIDQLSKIDHVKTVEKGITMMMNLSNKIKYNEKEKGIQIVATMSANVVDENIVLGKRPGKNELLINESLANKFADQMNNLIGQKVTLELVIDQKEITEDFVISGIYGVGASGNFRNVTEVFVNYNDVESIAKTKDYELKPTTIYLLADKQENVDKIKLKTEEMGYSGSKQEQLLNMFMDMLDIMTYILSAIAGISLFVSAIMILVVLYISVVERTQEIGVLKAIGARRKDIKRIFVSESFLIGLFSGIIGIIGALLLKTIINLITNRIFEVKLVSITLTYMLIGLAVSIIVSVLAGLYPASKAAKLDPVESLRRE